ncbi:MAG: glycosyl hydrolase, partial [Verrucomicrobiota bacterium]
MTVIKKTAIGVLLSVCWITVYAADELAANFASPPNESKPWCYWWWLNGAASKEGITRDFEAMRKQGISGALLFDAGEAGAEAPRGPKFMSAEWRDLYQHAVREADRCGIVLGVNLCSGWNAGGPWVTPEHAAKRLISAETVLRGPGRVSVALPKLALVQGYYHEIAVLAAPTTQTGELRASSQYQDYGPALAEDGSDESRWVSNGGKPGMGPTPDKPEFLQFDFLEPRTAAGIFLKPYAECGPKDVEVQSSDDGEHFRTIKRLTLKPRDAVTVGFDEVRSRHFRVLFLSAHLYNDGATWNVQVAEIALLSKNELANEPAARRLWDHGRVVDVTQFADASGQFNWEVPPGNWRVLRLGCTLHGNVTSCVGSGPGGLELDPMSGEAMDAHFAETGAKLIADAGPLAGKALQYFHIDSWELGQPTWTLRMRAEFQQRRGYDPLPFLPAVLGRTVDNAESTRRFLQDYRRTAADLVAANYYVLWPLARADVEGRPPRHPPGIRRT